MVLASGLEPIDSSPAYNPQCSSQQVPSLMPITHLAHLPPSTTLRCSLYLRVSYGLPPSLFLSYFFLPFPCGHLNSCYFQSHSDQEIELTDKVKVSEEDEPIILQLIKA